MLYPTRVLWKTAFLAAATSLLALQGAVRAQTPIADYEFKNTYDSSVGGAQTLTALDPSDLSFTTANVDGMPQTVLTVDQEAGVQTPGQPFTDSGIYSIVLLADFSTISSTAFSKVFDFKSLGTDGGLYVDGTTGLFQFIDGTGVPVTGATGAIVIPTGVFFQLSLTRNAAGLVTGYVDGTQDFSFDDSMSQLATLNTKLTLYQDDGLGLAGGALQESSAGDLARLRLYDSALTAGQIAALVPEPSTWVMLAGGVMVLGCVTLRRRRVA